MTGRDLGAVVGVIVALFEVAVLADPPVEVVEVVGVGVVEA